MDDPLAGLNLPKRRVITRPASRLRRVLAFAVDIIILQTFTLGPLGAIVRGSPLGEVTKELSAVFVVTMLVFLGYFWLLEYALGQTPGQLLFRLETKRATFWRAFFRNLHFFPLMPFPLLLIIEPIAFLITGERLLARWTATETVEQVTP